MSRLIQEKIIKETRSFGGIELIITFDNKISMSSTNTERILEILELVVFNNYYNNNK